MMLANLDIILAFDPVQNGVDQLLIRIQQVKKLHSPFWSFGGAGNHPTHHVHRTGFKIVRGNPLHLQIFTRLRA
ncbi:hypothetical protein D3C77_441670 [compost metagenome]